MRWYSPVPGVRLESIGLMWAAYSPLSGETHLLNDESAAIVEWLAEQGSSTTARVAAGLAAELSMELAHLESAVELAWTPLCVAGLVRQRQDRQ